MRSGLTQIITFPPDGSGSGISLAHIGHVKPATYSFACPGGCDQLTTTVSKTARDRPEALNPGRLVYAYRGGSVVWSGTLDEPSPGLDGWSVSAHGSGGWGVDYRAIYSPPWNTSVFNDAVDQAIARGLNWVRGTNITGVSGVWLGQQVDSAANTIADFLNLACNKGGLTWQVTTQARGNVLTVVPLPTVPNRLLISTDPVGQSLASGPNALYLRYQTSTDTTKVPAQYAITSVVRQDAIDRQGRREDFTDLSSAGVQTSGAAQGVGNSVFKRFTRAGFTDAFSVKYRQLTNLGGTPVDPGVFYADGFSAMVCKVLLSDFAFGGEVAKGPLSFLVGHYEWNDATCVATVTPFETMRHDFASLLQVAVDAMPVRRHHPTHKKKKAK
jgi:hypothetical protein